MSQNLSSVAVVIGALRVKTLLYINISQDDLLLPECMAIDDGSDLTNYH